MKHKLFISALGGASALLAAAGYYTFRLTVIEDNPMWKKPRKEPDPQSEKGKLYFAKKQAKENMAAIPYEDEWITSDDGLKLHARWYPNENAKRIMILCHGYHGSPESDFCFSFPMLKWDCAILAIDERSMGESEGKYITFGAKEKDDIAKWTVWMSQHNEKNLPVYLYGVSMGASNVLMNADRDLPGVRGIIADCGYTTMDRIVADVQKSWYKVSLKPVRLSLDCWCRLLAGFSMKEADTLGAMRRALVPVLFFHGKKDRFVKPYHTELNADACVSEHETVYVEGASHGASAQIDPARYDQALRNFFHQYDA